MNHLLGWAAFDGFILCCCYFWLKRIKLSKTLNVKNTLKSHYILGIISLVLAILHTGWNLFEMNTGYFGYIALGAMLLVILSGAVMKYRKGLSVKKRTLWMNAHRIGTVLLAVVLFFHIVIYFIMS